MKKFIIFLIFMPQLFYGQWVQQVSGTTESLNDIYCVTEYDVVAVGNNGTILKTINGGTTWIQKASGATDNLKKVQFVNNSVGYIIGENGKIIKTLDNGENWNIIQTNLTTNIDDISCFSDNIFYFTSNGVLYKSIDGGVNIQVKNSTQLLQNIQFTNEMIGYACSYNTLLKTIDGGYSWIIVGNVNYDFGFSPFYFFNESIGYIVNLNGLYKTINGGADFTLLEQFNFNSYFKKLCLSKVNIVWGLPIICPLNGDPCYNMRLEEASSSNLLTTNVYPLLSSINFLNENVGFGVDLDGHIFKNSTGQLAINKEAKKVTLKIVPNPTTDQISILLDDLKFTTFDIDIIDAFGKKIFSKSYENEKLVNINTTSFAKGFFILTITSVNFKQTEKIIIN